MGSTTYCKKNITKYVSILVSAHPARCNWCHKNKPLVKDKRFCANCAEEGRECAHCHRPLPPKYYGLDLRRCNTCYRKYERQRAVRKLSEYGF